MRLSDPGGIVVGMQQLTEDQKAMLEFERYWWQYTGSKEQAIRDRFGVSTTTYYQSLNSLIDRPEAMAYDPLVVKRLQRLREMRKRRRDGVRSAMQRHPSRAPRLWPVPDPA